MIMDGIRIGWAQENLTPDRPVYNGGQIYPRIAKYAHDPLTVTALALEQGGEQAIWLSLDMMSAPEPPVIERVRRALAGLSGFRPENLLVSVTHTHNSLHPRPFLFAEEAMDLLGRERLWLPEADGDLLEGAALEDFLAAQMERAARRAWLGRAPGGVSCQSDYAAVAFNRRPIFGGPAGEETAMYGDCARDDFLRYEAGSDHGLTALYTWSEAGQLTGVAVCVPCPAQVFELHSFLSADYWHYARAALREKLGNVFVLPLCSAAGDQNPLDLTRISKANRRELAAWGAQAGEVWRNLDMADACRDIADRIADAVQRGFFKARNRIEREPAFRHALRQLDLPLRQVTRDEYAAARAQIERAQAAFSAQNPARGADLVRLFEPMGVVARYAQQRRSATVRAPLRCLRVADTAFVTCPFELFVEYSLRIQARAASPQTAVVQLTDLYLDYLPTRQAIAGGSYSSAPASTTCGPESGRTLVEEALQMIAEMWNRR